MNEIHYFGIRHHGPGSARRVLQALEQLRPATVLIEGPADCSTLLPLLAHPQMKPPVALLAYLNDDAMLSLYYPFAEFSPEYQACCWALSADAAVRFVDLPVAVQLAQMQQARARSEDDGDEGDSAETTEVIGSDALTEEGPHATLHDDPIGVLARLAGYEDGESWWNDHFEQGGDNDMVLFDTVADTMQTLRESADEASVRQCQREAYMRLQIADALKTAQGPVAVVCGAWHVPALRAKVSQKEDKATLKALPPKYADSRLRTTWIPWTSPRLASRSGYGAGVAAPMWYRHLWRQGNHAEQRVLWLTEIATHLRTQGHTVSTASVIEAVRLCHSLAQVRGRPSPGFEETREAAIACLCFGEPLLWQQLEQDILLGQEVGEIPADGPLVPLLEDLQKWQKKTRLKPEALEKELALDLRTEAGLTKSILLHRLRCLDVPWGRETERGSSRGTFRERWILAWEPEFAVQLVENLVFGSTLAQAAGNRLIHEMHGDPHLRNLAALLLKALEAQLDDAVEKGFQRLEARAAHTSDGIELLESLPSLIDISRYGTSREMSMAHINGLISRLTVQASLAMPYACRHLNDEEATHYRRSIHKVHDQLQVAQLEDSVMVAWWQALSQLAESPQSSPQISGLCCRLLYQEQRLAAESLQGRMARMLSSAIDIAAAAAFFEGFFEGAAERLLYDDVLRCCVETWLIALTEEDFISVLPLLRRVFAALDAMERRRLLDAALGQSTSAHHSYTIAEEVVPLWPDHLQRIAQLVQGNSSWEQ